MTTEIPALTVVTTHSVRDRNDSPRRHLDVMPLPASARAVVAEWFDSDEEVQTAFHERRFSTVRRLVGGLQLLLKHRRTLSNAAVIYCLDGIHFNWLILLSRSALFRANGKTIRRFAFRDRAIQRLAPLLKTAPPAFQVDYITPEQVTRAIQATSPGRIRLHPWRVDTHWYQPASASSSTRPALLAGNMFRDDSLVGPLLQAGISVCRLGRHSQLHQRFAEYQNDPHFSLVVNAPHRDYLHHLQQAATVLLPIQPCDEPAGLTAAMEAVACEVPVLANHSMGIADLFLRCDYPLPLLSDLSPASWIDAVRTLDRRRQHPSFKQQLSTARQRLIEHHGIRPGASDWESLARDSTFPA